MTSHSNPLSPGDLLKIERRFVVDGVVSRLTDKGRYAGVQVVGTSEHLVLECPKKKSIRMFPLHAISEITLVEPVIRDAATTPVTAETTLATATPTHGKPAWDPGIA